MEKSRDHRKIRVTHAKRYPNKTPRGRPVQIQDSKVEMGTIKCCSCFSTTAMVESDTDEDNEGEEGRSPRREDDPEVNRLVRDNDDDPQALGVINMAWDDIDLNREVGGMPNMVMIHNARNMAEDHFLAAADDAQQAAEVVDGGDNGGDEQWLQAAQDEATRRVARAFYAIAVRNVRVRGISVQEAFDEIERGIPQGLAPNPDSNLISKVHTDRRPSNEGKQGSTYNTKKKKLMKEQENEVEKEAKRRRGDDDDNKGGGGEGGGSGSGGGMGSGPIAAS